MRTIARKFVGLAVLGAAAVCLLLFLETRQREEIRTALASDDFARAMTLTEGKPERRAIVVENLRARVESLADAILEPGPDNLPLRSAFGVLAPPDLHEAVQTRIEEKLGRLASALLAKVPEASASPSDSPSLLEAARIALDARHAWAQRLEALAQLPRTAATEPVYAEVLLRLDAAIDRGEITIGEDVELLAAETRGTIPFAVWLREVVFGDPTRLQRLVRTNPAAIGDDLFRLLVQAHLSPPGEVLRQIAPGVDPRSEYLADLHALALSRGSAQDHWLLIDEVGRPDSLTETEAGLRPLAALLTMNLKELILPSSPRCGRFALAELYRLVPDNASLPEPGMATALADISRKRAGSGLHQDRLLAGEILHLLARCGAPPADAPVLLDTLIAGLGQPGGDGCREAFLTLFRELSTQRVRPGPDGMRALADFAVGTMNAALLEMVVSWSPESRQQVASGLLARTEALLGDRLGVEESATWCTIAGRLRLEEAPPTIERYVLAHAQTPYDVRADWAVQGGLEGLIAYGAPAVPAIARVLAQRMAAHANEDTRARAVALCLSTLPPRDADGLLGAMLTAGSDDRTKLAVLLWERDPESAAAALGVLLGKERETERCEALTALTALPPAATAALLPALARDPARLKNDLGTLLSPRDARAAESWWASLPAEQAAARLLRLVPIPAKDTERFAAVLSELDPELAVRLFLADYEGAGATAESKFDANSRKEAALVALLAVGRPAVPALAKIAVAKDFGFGVSQDHLNRLIGLCCRELAGEERSTFIAACRKSTWLRSTVERATSEK